jgi:hypothetical protein
MAEKLDPRQVVTVRGTAPGDDVRAGSHTAGLVKKGLLTNEEVLEEINVVRREMEGNGDCGGNNYKGNL